MTWITSETLRCPSGIDEDSFEVITDGEVDVCFDGW